MKAFIVSQCPVFLPFLQNIHYNLEVIMKRYLSVLIIFLLLIIPVTGCNQLDSPQESTNNTPAPAPVEPTQPEPEPTQTPEPEPEPEPELIGRNLSIVSTIFPQYDWVRQIIGDKAEHKELTLIINNRIDLHNFQPSVSDIAKISTCDLFIYVGGESDDWAKDVLAQATNPDMVVINLLDLLGDAALIDEEIDDGHHHHHHHHDDDEYDEHVWLSVRNAIAFSIAISETLSALDPELSDFYQTNLAEYIEKLSALDAEYKEIISGASVDTLLFADRFPFRYLLHDYDLNFYAAFSGCSAETEASFQTIAFLVRKLNELSLNYVMVTESSDKSIAETVISNSRTGNQQILVLDSMQSSNDDDWQRGVSFLSIMESNLRILKEALENR
jgi:zinc transport system substrate-binding protein